MEDMRIGSTARHAGRQHQHWQQRQRHSWGAAATPGTTPSSRPQRRHALTAVAGFSMWMIFLKSIGVAMMTESQGTALMEASRSAICGGRVCRRRWQNVCKGEPGARR